MIFIGERCMYKMENSRGIIEDVLCYDKRVKRDVVVTKNKSARGRKNYIEN